MEEMNPKEPARWRRRRTQAHYLISSSRVESSSPLSHHSWLLSISLFYSLIHLLYCWSDVWVGGYEDDVINIVAHILFKKNHPKEWRSYPKIQNNMLSQHTSFIHPFNFQGPLFWVGWLIWFPAQGFYFPYPSLTSSFIIRNPFFVVMLPA